LPHNSATVSGLDEYADGCLFEKGADLYPFCLGGAPKEGARGWVVGQGGPAQKLGMPVQILVLDASWYNGKKTFLAVGSAFKGEKLIFHLQCFSLDFPPKMMLFRLCYHCHHRVPSPVLALFNLRLLMHLPLCLRVR
jgi:hypothetical protein